MLRAALVLILALGIGFAGGMLAGSGESVYCPQSPQYPVYSGDSWQHLPSREREFYECFAEYDQFGHMVREKPRELIH